MKEATEEELQEEAQAEEEVLAATQARLSILNGDATEEEEDDDDQTEESEEESKSTPDPDPEEEEEEEDEAGEEEEEEESTSEEETVEVDELPDAYLRAAIHQGWTKEDVKEFFEASPEIAMKTFAKIHESTNKLSADFAKLGRVEPEKKTPEAGKKTATDTEDDDTLAKLKEEYGDDSIMVKAFESLQGRLEIAEAAKVEAEPEPEADSAVQATVDKFFTDPTLKPYVDFYGEGKDAKKLTGEQMDNRWALLDMADRIIVGSEKQGNEMTPEKAMELAHLSVSEKVRTQALRNELKSKVVKRAKGVTLKPKKNKKVAPVKSAKRTATELEGSVAAKLKKTFN